MEVHWAHPPLPRLSPPSFSASTWYGKTRQGFQFKSIAVADEEIWTNSSHRSLVEKILQQ